MLDLRQQSRIGTDAQYIWENNKKAGTISPVFAVVVIRPIYLFKQKAVLELLQLLYMRLHLQAVSRSGYKAAADTIADTIADTATNTKIIYAG